MNVLGITVYWIRCERCYRIIWWFHRHVTKKEWHDGVLTVSIVEVRDLAGNITEPGIATSGTFQVR